MSTSKPAPQPTSKPASKPASLPSQGRAPAGSPRAWSGSTAPAPNARRRAAKRREAFGRRFRQFETTLPGLRMESMRDPALPLSAIGFTGFVWSKAISLALLVGVLFTLIWINGDERWYVYPERVTVTGQRLVAPAVLADAANVSGWNVYWLRRNEIRDRVLKNPWVTAAGVSLRLPAQVQVEVSEAPAIAVWSTEQGEFWISPTGAALPMQEPAPADMPRLVDPTQAAARPGSRPGTAVDTNVVASALALIANVPGVTEVRYSAEVGLHFGLPGTNLYVHWGDGENVARKLEMLQLGRELAATGEMDGVILDVRFPDVVTTR